MHLGVSSLFLVIPYRLDTLEYPEFVTFVAISLLCDFLYRETYSHDMYSSHA